MASKTFRNVEVWQRSHTLVLEVYRLTATFPKTEWFGLVSQLRRSVVSVPANFAEGFKKRGRLEKARFYNIAQGSLEEARYYLILAQDLRYGDYGAQLAALDQVSRMLDDYRSSTLIGMSVRAGILLFVVASLCAAVF